MSENKKSGKKVALAMAAYISGLAALPVIVFVNAVAGIAVMSLPVALVLMAS